MCLRHRRRSLATCRVDYASPRPANLTSAISDMQLAFTDAAGRAPNFTELGAGGHRRNDPHSGRLQLEHRGAHPADLDSGGERHERLNLPDRADSHREQRDQRPSDWRRAPQERLLGGRGGGGARDDRALRGDRPDPNLRHAGDGRLDQRAALAQTAVSIAGSTVTEP